MQCQATRIKDGKPCQKLALEGSLYCGIHKNFGVRDMPDLAIDKILQYTDAGTAQMLSGTHGYGPRVERMRNAKLVQVRKKIDQLMDAQPSTSNFSIYLKLIDDVIETIKSKTSANGVISRAKESYHVGIDHALQLLAVVELVLQCLSDKEAARFNRIMGQPINSWMTNCLNGHCRGVYGPP